MRFAHLPSQPPIFPAEAEEYARSTLSRSDAAAQRCERIVDVAYGPDPKHTVDIFVPRTRSEKDAPVLVFAHGGAWTNGYKEWMGLLGPAMTEAGIVLVSVSYRLAPEHKWDQMVDDCRQALAWVHQNIRQHGGDPQRIVVGGHSAGGHLMMLTALQTDKLEAAGVPSTSLMACVPLCAPLDIRYPDRQPGSGEERTHQMVLRDASEAAQASPISHLHAGMPFTLLTYAANDFPRIVAGNRATANALREQGLAHDVLVVEGDHFSAALDIEAASAPWTRRVIGLLLDSSH